MPQVPDLRSLCLLDATDAQFIERRHGFEETAMGRLFPNYQEMVNNGIPVDPESAIHDAHMIPVGTLQHTNDRLVVARLGATAEFSNGVAYKSIELFVTEFKSIPGIEGRLGFADEADMTRQLGTTGFVPFGRLMKWDVVDFDNEYLFDRNEAQRDLPKVWWAVRRALDLMRDAMAGR